MWLAFPAAAIKRPISLVGEAWDLVAGNYWRLIACVTACYAPFGVVEYIVGDIGGALPPIPEVIFRVVVRPAVWLAGAAVVASLLSDVYRRLSSRDAETERPT
jgi:hypothetical protein